MSDRKCADRWWYWHEALLRKVDYWIENKRRVEQVIVVDKLVLRQEHQLYKFIVQHDSLLSYESFLSPRSWRRNACWRYDRSTPPCKTQVMKKVAEWCYLNLVKWQESIRIRALKIYSMIGCTYVQQQRRKTLEQKFSSRKIDDLSQWLSNYWQV